MDDLFEPSGNPGDYADDGGIQVKNQRIQIRGVFSPMIIHKVALTYVQI